MRYLFIPLLVCLAPFVWAGQSIATKKCDKQAVAKLVSLQGSVFYDATNKGHWQLAPLNTDFCEGERIRVAALSRASLLLPGHIILRLDENSVLVLNTITPNKPTLLDLVKGFVHFISRTPKHLQINTPIANAGPEGTEFAIHVTDKQASLWVYEGGVRFFNDKGSIRLKPGQGGQVLVNQAPRAQIDITPQDAVAWAMNYPTLLPSPKQSIQIDNVIRSAIQAFRQGHVDVALNQLDAIAPEKRNDYFYQVRGAIRLTAGRITLAKHDIQVLLADNPKEAVALALQSVLALTQNRKDEAYALANQAVNADKHSAVAYSALSYAEQAHFKLDKALAAAKLAVHYAPNDAMVLARKAELELAQGATSDSEQTAKQALALEPDLERVQTIAGFAYLLKMQTNEALHAFEKAVTLDSTAPLARLGLGLAKIRLGDLAKGREDLEIAAVLDPNNSLVRSYLGKAYYEEKRSPLANDQFTLAKERDPKDPTPYFYDAILKQTTNRPVEALYDMQKAIELNDNRAVYRSQLALDEDKAVRSASLGRIYKELGLDDPARLQATHSLTIDPGNYSAHRLLADSYFYRPRQELARASEILQSQLLQPLNFNPIQPQLAYTDLNIPKSSGFADTAFNEYSRFFEGDQDRFTATGLYGSNDTRSDEMVLSGIHKKFAYSLGQMHYQTDGFRANADLKHNLYNAFAQYEFSPELSAQVEYRHRETEHGDIQMKGTANDFKDDITTDFDNTYRRHLQQNTYRIGGKFSPTPHSNLLSSFIYTDRYENVTDFIEFTNRQSGYQIETQYLYNSNHFNLIIGGGTYQTNNYRTISFLNISDKSNRNQNFAYFYTNINVSKNITATTGINYDSYDDYKIGANVHINQFSPKLGLQWHINEALTFRVAGFQNVKAPILVNQTLQPMQIAGFNQFFDDINGTRSTQYGIGLDAHLSNNLYTGAEVYKRDLDVPLVEKQAFVIRKREEELYRLYFHWIPTNYWVLNSELRFESFHAQKQEEYQSVKSAYIPLNIRFFNDAGFFADIGGQFVHQSVLSTDQESFNSNFFLLDAALGYRFPQRYGMLSLEAKNLLDKNFKYRDRSFQINEVRASDLIPERLLFARINLNF